MYEIIPTKNFENDIKFYIKKCKYRNIDDDIDKVVQELESGNFLGEALDDIRLPDGEDTYKVRIANSNTKVGKSNGYRLIYYANKNEKIIFLLTIYYKKDDNRIPDKNEIIDIVKKYCSD